jgi:hypothetical protein
MIDPKIFATYMTAISDRLKTPMADATHALYYLTLSNAMTTEQFEQAARQVFLDYSGFSFPAPQVFLDMLPRPPVDAELILRRIHDLGEYSPNGWRYPSVALVRERLGVRVGDAYGAAGASSRLFADGDAHGLSTTRDIARRDFGKELEAAQRSDPNVPLLPNETSARLTAGEQLLPTMECGS